MKMPVTKTVEIVELKPLGPVKQHIKFASFIQLDAFLQQYVGYTKDKCRRHSYFLEGVERSNYAVVKVNGKKVLTERMIERFYDRKRWDGKIIPYVSRRKLTKAQMVRKRINHLKAEELLRKIDAKYGGVTDAAEGSPELAKLRKLLGA